MESLDHAVRLRVVAGGPEAADAKYSHDATPYLGLELATAVEREAERDAKPGNPRLHEGTSHRVGGDVRQWGSFGPSGEAVHAGEQVLVTPGEWQGAHNVDVDVLKPGGDWREGAWRGAGVACDLGGLALEAGAGPQPYVLVHAGPFEAGRHQLL